MAKKDLVEARVISRKKKAILLEVMSEGKPYRFTLPADKVEIDGSSARVSEEQISLGIPYGIPWEEILSDHTITSDQLSDALHANGIWTYEDVRKNPEGVQSSLFSCLRLSLADFMRKAKEYQFKEISHE